MDKRGQGLSVTAIILIVLGILVLVMLIMGFMFGWEKIMPWIKPSNNVDEIVNACKLACSTQAKFAYCSEPRELNDGEKVLEKVNCNFLANIKEEYGIEKCLAISCDNIPSDATDEDGAKISCAGQQVGKEIEYLAENELKNYTCQQADITTP